LELLKFIGSLHPFFATLPVPLVLAALLWEICCFIYARQCRPGLNDFLYLRGLSAGARFLLVGLASVGVIFAFITGYIAQDYADQSFCVPNQAIAQHFIWGRILLIGIVPFWGAVLFFSTVTISRLVHWIIFIGALIVFLATALVTSYFGGNLVFNHGAGVSVTATPKISNCPEEP